MITNNDFNSTRFPGKCYATNPTTLEKFKELQRQINRVAKMRGWTTIAVDGYIGPQTVDLFNKIYANSQSCSQICLFTEAYIPQIKVMADQLGAPTIVTAPKPPSPPAYLPPTSNVLVPQPATSSLLDAAAGMGLSSMHLMLIAGVGGLIVYKKFIKGGGAQRRSWLSRRTNRRN